MNLRVRSSQKELDGERERGGSNVHTVLMYEILKNEITTKTKTSVSLVPACCLRSYG